jgi:hypothetical protein
MSIEMVLLMVILTFGIGFVLNGWFDHGTTGARQPNGFGGSPAPNPAARPASVSSYVYRSRDLILIQRFSTALFNPRWKSESLTFMK